jgi:hypothetical protein
VNGHLTEEDLLLLHYGEIEDPSAAEGHLLSCDACRESRDALLVDLATLEGDAVPERGAGYGAEVWARVKPGLRPPTRIFGLTPRQFAMPAAMAATIVLAFFVGRVTHVAPPSPTPPPQIVEREVVRERILVVAVGDHLEKSRMVLVELSHAGNGKRKVNIAAEQQWAENLLANNRLYRQTAMRAGESKVASVLDDLERLLVEVASGPSELTPEEIKALRKRIDSGGLLFKVKVMGSQLRGRERAPAHDAAPKVIS